MPIDILSGSSMLREAVECGFDAAGLDRLTAVDEAVWWRDVDPYLLYE